MSAQAPAHYLLKPDLPVGNGRHLRAIVEQLIRLKGPSVDLNHLDVSAVTQFDQVFKHLKFTGNISKWDVSNGVSFDQMFSNSTFNGDLSSWNMSNAKNLEMMFYHSSFNQNISTWDVSNVEEMSMMFKKSPFYQSIAAWDLSRLTLFNWEHEACIFDDSPVTVCLEKDNPTLEEVLAYWRQYELEKGLGAGRESPELPKKRL